MSGQSQVISADVSPMLRQYWDVKAEHPDSLLFFRVGDFYELFDTDAEVAARELDITLTGRPEPSFAHRGGRVPMAGVPVRSVESYVGRLISKGYAVAICEQVGVVGASKGPVERKVTRILTPGTVLESELLPARENNYLVALVRGSSKKESNTWGLACVDASCGEFLVTELSEDKVSLEIARLSPREILAAKVTKRPDENNPFPQEVLDLPEELLKVEGRYRFTGRPSMFFQKEPSIRRIKEIFNVTTLEGFGCQNLPVALGACGAALEYLQRTQGVAMPKFQGISTYSVDGHLILDANTRRNLELTQTSRDQSFMGSLLWSLDNTKTAMGARMLRRWLLEPLCNVPAIRERQDAVEELSAAFDLRERLEKLLLRLSDLERLGVKLSSQSINPRELAAVADSLSILPELSQLMTGARSGLLTCFQKLPSRLIELAETIENALTQEPPRELTGGGIFKSGYSAELDEVRALLGGGKEWIENFQKSQQEETGIKSLKVGFNQNFGYFIEVTHANKSGVPEHYIRKQTLTNAERYITPELKEYEAKILNAEKNQNDLEYKCFLQLRETLSSYGFDLKDLSLAISSLDALLSLAIVACQRKYVRPVVDESLDTEIANGRHPVLEQILPMGQYVSNCTSLFGDNSANQLIVLTGPNMSGKSSYLRQIAHITILAQMGGFVPADSAKLGLVDRIFTRIGAVDDLSQGQSTFLVEMSETTQCCLSATRRSLILLDEVGRGTSTYDGVAIAWSVAEYLANVVKARTIFATHYHELNGLAAFYPHIANYQVEVRETGDHVEFIRRVVPGGASRSFGIQVARMAGLPMQVIERAENLMTQMVKKSAASKILDGPKFRSIVMEDVMQLSLFSGTKPTSDRLST